MAWHLHPAGPVWPLQCRRRSHGHSIPDTSLHLLDSLQMAQEIFTTPSYKEGRQIHQHLALPFISSLALLASSSEANFTKPNPFGLLVTLSVTIVAALKHEAPACVTANDNGPNDYQTSSRSVLLQVMRINLLLLGRNERTLLLGCLPLQTVISLKKDRGLRRGYKQQ